MTTNTPNQILTIIDDLLQKTLIAHFELFTPDYLSTQRYIYMELCNQTELEAINNTRHQTSNHIQIKLIDNIAQLKDINNVDINEKLIRMLFKYFYTLITDNYKYPLDNDFAIFIIELLIDNNITNQNLLNKLFQIIINTSNIKLFNVLFKKEFIRHFLINDKSGHLIPLITTHLQKEMLEQLLEIQPEIINMKFKFENYDVSLLYCIFINTNAYYNMNMLAETAMIKLVLDKGIDINVMDAGQNVLHNAIRYWCNAESLKLLLDACPITLELTQSIINYIKTRDLYKDDVELQDAINLRIFINSPRGVFINTCLQLGFMNV